MLEATVSSWGVQQSDGHDDAPGAGPAVLVVEDDQVVATMLASLLTWEGFSPTVVADGHAALRLVVETAPPDVVLLDGVLPHANGIEVLAAIRRCRAWRHVPVVMVSGRSSESDIVRAIEAGADDYVTKPFGPDELVARIRRQLRLVLV